MTHSIAHLSDLLLCESEDPDIIQAAQVVSVLHSHCFRSPEALLSAHSSAVSSLPTA